MFRISVAGILCVALVASGCASRSRLTLTQAAPSANTAPADNAGQNSLLADYLQRLAAGSKVRIERSNGAVLRGTLMNATADIIVVHENTRIPEAPIAIPISDVARVTVEGQSSVGKTVGIGVAAGAGATLGVLLLLAALLGD